MEWSCEIEMGKKGKTHTGKQEDLMLVCTTLENPVDRCICVYGRLHRDRQTSQNTQNTTSG